MTKNLRTQFATLGALSVLLPFGTACTRTESASKPNFVRMSATTALLEERDLKDKFVFGLNVIETKNFFSTALNLNFRPVECDLVLTTDANGRDILVVATAGRDGRKERLLSFNAVEKRTGKIEVDFDTAGNDLSLWNDYGGQIVDMDADRRAGSWKTAAAPRVVNVVQDPDSVIVDIIHTVSFVLEKDSADPSLARTGEVKIRLYLKRQDKNPTILQRTASMARSDNFGFFPAARLGSQDTNLPIAHYRLNVDSKQPAQQIIYLKDFPAEYEPVAKQAIESWNISFGFDAFKTERANDEIDLGDPRYNVVKWIDGLDEEVPWAGYAPTMVNPRTGEVIATQILINGSTTRKGFEDVYKYTTDAAPQFPALSGKIGNVPLVEGTGENPVVSFFADTKSKNQDDYIKGYYFSVIMHEFGHSLGLRHNFAGSTRIESNGLSSSVMDYEPGFVTNIRRVPGTYDTAAVRWGYFGERPSETFAFCTDEDIQKRYDCNQGDVGLPEDFVASGLIQGTTVLENLAVPLPDMVKKPMRSMMKTALKILSLADQLPEAKRETALANINRALERVKNAKADDGLSGSE
ncbi:MAG: hypothetical protein EBR09_05345, partial [Proteobacteria bacterium]|nr:hypothetical protein [Pseudomonadota bacterium]